MEHPLVNVITHPANRVPGRSEGYDARLGRRSSGPRRETGTAVEIDGAPGHIDLDGRLARGMPWSWAPRWSWTATVISPSGIGRQMRIGRRHGRAGRGRGPPRAEHAPDRRNPGFRGRQARPPGRPDWSTRPSTDSGSVTAEAGVPCARSCCVRCASPCVLSAVGVLLGGPRPLAGVRTPASRPGRAAAGALRGRSGTFPRISPTPTKAASCARRPPSAARWWSRSPGKMRWAYTAPEEKLFVSDGRKLYAWVPADRQVTVSTLPQANEAATPALFLMGRGHLATRLHAEDRGPPGALRGERGAAAHAEGRGSPEYEHADDGGRSRSR